MSRTSPAKRLLMWSAAAGLALLLGGCEEKRPVTHTVALRFQDDASVLVRIETVLLENPETPEVVTNRILPVLDRYERGKDEWLLRMGEWGLSEVSHERSAEGGAEGGASVHSILRTGLAADGRHVVPEIFAREPVFVDLAWERGLWTLELFPQAEPRDLRDRRAQARSEVGRLAAGIASTQEALRDLYDYLRDNPERRVPVLLGIKEEEDREILDEEEARLYETLDERFERIILHGPLLDKAWLMPLDELLEVELPRPAREVAGFAESGTGGRYEIPKIDLDDVVLGALEAPFDPKIVGLLVEDEVDPDLVERAAFHVAPLPFERDIRRDLWNALSRAGPYRLRWEGPAPEDP